MTNGKVLVCWIDSWTGTQVTWTVRNLIWLGTNFVNFKVSSLFPLSTEGNSLVVSVGYWRWPEVSKQSDYQATEFLIFLYIFLMHECYILSHFSRVQLFVTPWTITLQLQSSVHGDSASKNTRVGCQSLLQRIFPTQGWNPTSLMSPALAGGFFTTSASLFW